MSTMAFPATITAWLQQFRAGRTAASLVSQYLRRISEINPNLQSYLTVCAERAQAAAAGIDALGRHFPAALGPLAGVPISIKDLIDTSFAPTTYGSRAFHQHQPTSDALIVRRLEMAGAITLGKTHLHEFAYGITNENEHFGPARNPVDPARITGGSSGGSAASVKADLALASIGTDSGGSVRIPASLTGVVGFKPSHGLVPLTGVFPLAPTLDHVGPLTKCVADAAIIIDVLAGLTDAQALAPKLAIPRQKPLRVGIPEELITRFVSPEVDAWFQATVRQLETQHTIEIVAAIALDIDAIAVHQASIMSAEAYAQHAIGLQEKGEFYGADVFERLQAASATTAEDYIRAHRYRATFQAQIASWFADIDALLLPTTPITAPNVGTKVHTIHGEEHLLRQLMTRFTNPWNLAGIPAISLPAGNLDGLPIGLQLVGEHGHDAELLRAAAFVEACLQTN